MNTENTESGSKICPFCSEQIKQAAIKCKHCGEFLFEERAPVDIKTINSELTIKDKPKFLLFVLLLCAALLHVLFCAESPLLFISVSNPISSIVGSLGYSIPGMIISIIFLVPIANYFTKDNAGEGFFKGFTLKSVTIALYIGATIRLALCIIKCTS